MHYLFFSAVLAGLAIFAVVDQAYTNHDRLPLLAISIFGIVLGIAAHLFVKRRARKGLAKVEAP